MCHACPGALQKLRRFWTRVWDRESLPQEVAIEEYLHQWQESRQQMETWPLVTAEALRDAAAKQRPKAGGTDGWTGTELAALPLKFWAQCLPIFHSWESRGCCSRGWQEIRQTHLPKQNVSPMAVPTSKMRPISLLFAWWRIFLHAKLSSDAAQTWYQQQLRPQQHGCRKGKEAITALIPMATAKARGRFLASLGLSLAFDQTHPNRVLGALQWRGFPNKLAKLVFSVWCNQSRTLQWAGHSGPTPCAVSASMHQGDSLSPWGLNVFLATPT